MRIHMADICAKNEDYISKIGILGGTFDPIHKGHVALGEAAMREVNLDKLIVMPARIQPFKQGKKVTEDYHRQAMVLLAFEGEVNVTVSEYEMNNMSVSYTYDTLTHLRKELPHDKLYFIMGTDSLLHVEKWYKGIELLKNFAFIVSVRPGYKEEELELCISGLIKKYGTEIIKIDSPMPDISSTKVRKLIKNGKNFSDLVPLAVERYIKENGLYR